ncbi:MAG: hypothetical protein Q4G51_17435, partial [Dermatophilus congolensis]|nr:hypothetical protein [Dermatophilus congolensis]
MSSASTSDGVETDKTVDVLVREATAVLSTAGVPSPRRDAVLLLAHSLGVDAGEAEKAALMRRMPTHDQRERFATLLAERRNRVPLQHLTGRAPFRHLELDVGPGVFVPRPETEAVAGVVGGHRTAGATPGGARRPRGGRGGGGRETPEAQGSQPGSAPSRTHPRTRGAPADHGQSGVAARVVPDR